MTLWQQVQMAAGMGGSLAWVMLIFVAGSVTLMALRPAERQRIRNGLLLFLVSFGGLVIVGWLATYGISTGSSLYRWLRWAAHLCQWLAMLNFLSVLIFEVILDPLGLRPPRILRDLLLALAYVVAGITLLSKVGVDLTGIIATSAVLTAVIGLSFQDTLGNMMGGMALQMERSIGVGDWIRVDNQEGLVREVRWRHTAVETRNWDTIIIPNSVLMRSQVTVLGRRKGSPEQHRQWVYFNVDFRYSPAEVIDAVETALRAEPIANIAAVPPANCVLMDFKESYCSYAVRYWLTNLAVDDPTNSVVRTRIYFALHRASIPLSLPAHSLFVTENDSSRRERKDDEEIGHRVKTLNHIELFHNLTEAEKLSLASRLRVAPFAPGEAITRQGAEAHWLYVITEGNAEVRVSLDGSAIGETVATLHRGDFFGEMGMMTGAPRTATVTALSNVECYRLDKEAFDDILRSRPEIAEDVSQVLARRKVELDAVREDLNEEAKRARLRVHQIDLLARIKKFFTI